jgi:hypothetical protein
MPQNDSPSVMIEGARLLFRNFTGIEREFNSEGDRNFSVVLEPELAEKLKADGWRVKQLKPREEDEPGDYHLKVKVNYKKGRPPRCILITSNGRTELGSDEVSMLDLADIKNVDLIINGWWSDMAGGGYGAFLKTIYVTINEDELELKYNDQTGGHELHAKEQEDEVA